MKWLNGVNLEHCVTPIFIIQSLDLHEKKIFPRPDIIISFLCA